MSNRYKGGVISATPPTTTGGESGTASGAWTLEQQMQAQAAGNWPIQPLPKYIEDVFSTWLYTGNGSTQTITNGIDLSTKGGMVWTKNRTTGGTDNLLWDTVRGASYALLSNATDDSTLRYGAGNGVSAFGTTGFTINGNYVDFNASSSNYVSWTFREQPKFFDVVTYTGNGTQGRQIAHNLGAPPACIFVKRTSTTSNWAVYHDGIGASQYLNLNTTAAAASSSAYWDDASPTATVFTVGNGAEVNANGSTYVAYIFSGANGGFGLTGTDNVISCGSYTLDASGNADISLGYEPQWVLLKKTNGAAGWVMMDTMRGFSLGGDEGLLANSANAAFTYGANTAFPTATGFSLRGWGASGSQEIYIAIRRGPMKVPTDGTKVFSPTTNAGTGSNKTITTNFPVDLSIQSALSAATHVFTDRLRGGGVNLSPRVYSQFTDAETNTSGGRGILFDSNTSITNLSNYNNGVGDNYIYYGMRRAPGFFDEVCYTGTGSARTVTHNLTAVPELMIVKRRDVAAGWPIYSATLGASQGVVLQDPSAAFSAPTYWNSTSPTSSVFTTGTNAGTNGSGNTFVAYLFATCTGVSKVGSYTGTGTTQTINCGFTAGSRFVLIKRTDSTGDWYVWDSARGIVAGNDPYLLLNSTAAEVTGTDYIDTAATGFEITSTAPAAINASGGTFIFLAIS